MHVIDLTYVQSCTLRTHHRPYHQVSLSDQTRAQRGIDALVEFTLEARQNIGNEIHVEFPEGVPGEVRVARCSPAGLGLSEDGPWSHVSHADGCALTSTVWTVVPGGGWGWDTSSTATATPDLPRPPARAGVIRMIQWSDSTLLLSSGCDSCGWYCVAESARPIPPAPHPGHAGAKPVNTSTWRGEGVF